MPKYLVPVVDHAGRGGLHREGAVAVPKKAPTRAFFVRKVRLDDADLLGTGEVALNFFHDWPRCDEFRKMHRATRRAETGLALIWPDV